jgi:hypothetical protein
MAVVIPDAWTMVGSFSGAGKVWHHSLDVQKRLSPVDTPPTSSDPIVGHFQAWSIDNLYPLAQMDSISLFKKRGGKGSLPIADTLPLWEIPVGLAGNRTTAYGTAGSTGGMDYQAVAYVRKLNNGRTGRTFIRCVLLEGDVQANAGEVWSFTGGSGTFNVTSFHTNMDTHLSDHLASGDGDYELCVVHIREDESGTVIDSSIQPVTDMVLAYAGWFKRAR